MKRLLFGLLASVALVVPSLAQEDKEDPVFYTYEAMQCILQIGYNRAARIIDMMEADGIVSKANHVGKRDVL